MLGGIGEIGTDPSIFYCSSVCLTWASCVAGQPLGVQDSLSGYKTGNCCEDTEDVMAAGKPYGANQLDIKREERQGWKRKERNSCEASTHVRQWTQLFLTYPPKESTLSCCPLLSTADRLGVFPKLLGVGPENLGPRAHSDSKGHPPALPSCPAPPGFSHLLHPKANISTLHGSIQQASVNLWGWEVSGVNLPKRGPFPTGREKWVKPVNSAAHTVTDPGASRSPFG